MTARVLILLTVTAVLAPAATVGAATRGASSPTAAARLHYRHIALKNFRAAYALLTPAAKKQVGPYARWKAGYADTGQVGIIDLRRTRNIVRFTLLSCRGDADREVTISESFSVRWPTARIDGRWFLDRGSRITRTSSEEVTKCQIPVP